MAEKMKLSKTNPLSSIRERILSILTLFFVAILILPYAHPISQKSESILKKFFVCDLGNLLGLFFSRFIISKNRRLFLRDNVFELLIVVLPFFRPLRLLRLVPVVAYFLKSIKHSLAEKNVAIRWNFAARITAPAATAVEQLERERYLEQIFTP
jgi:hypothetical protein